ncbi:MAG TPA: sulfotransferase [Planctomycetota bacterium]|nr:sulfotransferase [Planctomycetota bacterium]
MSGVFIASLGHSGSTLLDLMLGSHPRLVSLGEVHATIARAGEPQNPCTCGKTAEGCPIWGPALEEKRRAPDRPYGELYALVLRRVREVCGEGVAPVDSSKHVPALAALPAEARRALRVVFLVKDVRSFVASAVDRTLPWTQRHRNTTPWNVARWRSGNRRFEEYFAREGIAAFTLGYEELCFKPAAVVPKLCEFLGVPFDPAVLAPRGERAHILRGNRMRFDPERRAAVSYDARWMMGARTLWAAPWYLPVMGLNRRLVYSNLERPPSGRELTPPRSDG